LSAFNLSPITPSTKVAVDLDIAHTNPNTDDATPYEFYGKILFIIDIVFPNQTSANKTIKKSEEIDIQKLI